MLLSYTLFFLNVVGAFGSPLSGSVARSRPQNVIYPDLQQQGLCTEGIMPGRLGIGPQCTALRFRLPSAAAYMSRSTAGVGAGAWARIAAELVREARAYLEAPGAREVSKTVDLGAAAAAGDASLEGLVLAMLFSNNRRQTAILMFQGRPADALRLAPLLPPDLDTLSPLPLDQCLRNVQRLVRQAMVGEGILEITLADLGLPERGVVRIQYLVYMRD